MIQINLLPDVKLEYLRARSMKHLVVAASFLIIAVSLSILFILFSYVQGIQRLDIRNLNADIAANTEELSKVEDLDKILTIQNQLNNLTPLHEQKVVASRLQDYVSSVTPSQVTFSELDVNYEEFTIKMIGKADNLRQVNQFIDTMKFTTYIAQTAGVDAENESVEPVAESGDAFLNVRMAEFNRSEDGATFQIQLEYNPIIFDILFDVELFVPDIITTRSVVERPQTLFQPNPGENGGNQ
jgi:ABC-type lipoprotein release transport system permease subunit